MTSPAGFTADLPLTATPWDADAAQLRAHDVIETHDCFGEPQEPR